MGAFEDAVRQNDADNKAYEAAMAKGIKHSDYVKQMIEKYKKEQSVKPENVAFKNYPKYKKGGTVKKTGLALVHKGEKVLTKEQAAKPAVKKAIKKKQAAKPAVKKAIKKK